MLFDELIVLEDMVTHLNCSWGYGYGPNNCPQLPPDCN